MKFPSVIISITLFQRQRGFTHLTGVDYVQEAIDLAQGVLARESVADIKFEVRK